MTLKVIGSGFGRTGTMSMKDALGILGFGPTHHMTEVMEHPEQIAHWNAIFSGDEVDWADVFEGYTSQVDWPGAHVWHETSIASPEAKVIHAERPEDAWWASCFVARSDEATPSRPVVWQLWSRFSSPKLGMLASRSRDTL